MFLGSGTGIGSRLMSSAVLQGCYMRIRRVPIFGRLAHTLMQRILPSGTRLDVTVRAGLATGLSLSIDPRYEAQYAAGLYENALLECLALHLRKGDVFYDVGSHIGLVALVGARLVGPKGNVFAFEPDPENSSRVIDHARTNALPQIEVIRSAAWSECGTLSFQRGSDASSRNTGGVVESLESSNVGEVISIPAVTLDRFAEEHRAPNLIKVDVEGAEGEVLKGSQTILHDAKPILICEIHNAKVSTEVSNWLAERDYRWDWLGREAGFPRHLVAQARS